MEEAIYLIFAFIGVVAVLLMIGYIVALIVSSARTRADEHKAVEEFCKKRNYCYFGCGGGDGFDARKNYYGGYNCPSDHK